MKPLKFTNDYWRGTDSFVTFVADNAIPDLPVTGVKIYAIHQDELLLTKLRRGWEVPGGHVELGETPEAAVLRELKEETGATVQTYRLIGYLKITNIETTERNRRYPKEACILVYKGNG